MSKKTPITTKTSTQDKKLVILSKFKKDIAFIKDVYKTHDDIQEFLITTLATRLDIAFNSTDYLILCDYIYNDSDWMVEFKKEL